MQDQYNQQNDIEDLGDFQHPEPAHDIQYDNELEASEEENYQDEIQINQNDDESTNKERQQKAQRQLQGEAQMQEQHAEIQSNFSQFKREYISDYVMNIQQIKRKNKKREIIVILLLILLTTMLGFIFHQPATILSGIFNLISLIWMFYKIPKLPECYANMSNLKKKILWIFIFILITIPLIAYSLILGENMCRHREQQGSTTIIDYFAPVFGITKFVMQAIAGFIISGIIISPILIKLKKKTLVNLKNKEQEKAFTESFSEKNQGLEQMLTEDAMQEEDLTLNCLQKIVKKMDTKCKYFFFSLILFLLLICVTIGVFIKSIGPLFQLIGYVGILEIMFCPFGFRFFYHLPKLHKFMKESTFISILYLLLSIGAIVPSSQFSYACKFNYYGDILQGVFAAGLTFTIKQFFLVKWKRFYKKKKNWEEDVLSIARDLEMGQVNQENLAYAQNQQ